MSSQKTITMPDFFEIVFRLATVLPNEYAIERLYPKIATKMGGKRLNGEGIVNLLIFQCREFINSGLPDRLFELLMQTMPNWIAKLVDDKEVQEEALAFFERQMAILSKKK